MSHGDFPECHAEPPTCGCHDCIVDGCLFDGSLFCIYCGLTEEDTLERDEDFLTEDDGYYYSGTGEWSEDDSYIDYLNR